jgi:aspartate aminotransferase, cytoplasmic
MQSFAKNAGLYGERVGALHVIGATKDAASRIHSQLSVLQRSEISNPPAYGARIVSDSPLPSFLVHKLFQMAKIMNDPELFAEWEQNIHTMASRIITMREELRRLLVEEFKTPGSWDHITSQIGMFR